MKKYGIGARLLACASLIREGTCLADVGTDHAYLPIYLLEAGRISRAVLSDINEGPLESARRNVADSGFSDRADLFLCDGASALADSGAMDYAICGMGGELIADIIEGAPHLRSGDIHLILQPMSKKHLLRAYLFEHGFDVLKEVYSKEDGKHYVTLLAKYVGERVKFSEADAELGKIGAASVTEELTDYMRAYRKTLRKVASGKAMGGEDSSYEERIIKEIERRFDIK